MAQPPLGGAMHFQPGVPLRSICKGEGKGERKKDNQGVMTKNVCSYILCKDGLLVCFYIAVKDKYASVF